MLRKTKKASLDQAMQPLNETLITLRERKDPLTDNEKKFIEKMEHINSLMDKDCETFTIYFQLSEAHWLRSSIKYDESFQLYDSMHQTFLRLLDGVSKPVKSSLQVVAPAVVQESSYKKLLS